MSHPWTEDEKQAVTKVREGLTAEAIVPESAISEIELIVITLNAKCRVDEAVRKYTSYYENILRGYGIDDIWASHDTLHDQWHRFEVAGVDSFDRQIMWINGHRTPVNEERKCVHASALYNIAVHSDRHTLRNGVTMIIDTATQQGKKVGNEKKLQVTWQSFAARAQDIYILGTTAVTRITVNALIAFASLFLKSKVISRINFATVEMVSQKVGGAEKLPQVHGGGEKMDTGAWVKERLANFPRMGI